MGSVLRMIAPEISGESSRLGGPRRRPPASGAPAPTGVVALVFTDVQGSTRLWERCSGAMRLALDLHDQVLRALLAGFDGYEVKTQGDSFMVAFGSAVEAVRWCLEAQEALLHAPWPEELLAEADAREERGPRGLVHRGLRVRMGVHLGEPECRIDARTGRADYFGRMVNVTARVTAAGHGGQVLVSGEAWARVVGEQGVLGEPVVRPLGEYHLKGIDEAMRLVEVLPASLADRRFEAPRVPRVRRGNVPTETGELVGRQEELELLRRCFDEGARLVTLLGPGGMGKSRLATRFGNAQLTACAWDGGVWMCELTEASTVDDICHAVGASLGVALTREGEDKDPSERLGRALGGRGDVLLILDNVEHVLPHLPATLGRWRALAPRARFLVTSREALLFPEEQVVDLEPLAVPEEGETRLERLAASDAVHLFVQRARAVRGGFELTEADAPLVADIVRKLDGIPLAIELAAARTNLLGVGQIHQRLSRRFELLRGGRRDGSARQSTLWGAIDWSWNLLEPAERAALAQCSVFRGGFTLEAAESVLMFPPGGPDVMEIIHSLRSKSLLRTYAPDGLPGELRLGLYESIRQYASSRLAERGEGSILVARHAGYYLGLARRLSTRGKDGEQAFRWLSLERENLLAACDNALAVLPASAGSVERALGALVALEPDVTARGPVGMTLSRLDKALELAEGLDVEPLLRAEALAVRGRTHLGAGQLAGARKDLERARGLFHQLEAVERHKRVLVDLSIVARDEGDMGAAWELVREASALSSGGDRWLDAYTVGNLGILELGRHGAAAALPHLREALERFRAVGDVAFEVGFLTNYAMAIGEAGNTSEAVALLDEALEKASRVGDRAGHALARVNLGCFLLDAGRATESREHLEAVVRMGRQLGMRVLEGVALGELGRALVALGALAAARTFLTEATTILGKVSRWHALRFTAHLAAVQASLGDLLDAREGFAELEAAPELQGDVVLRELTSLLHASLDVAESLRASPDSAEGQRALAEARRRMARARSAPPEAASSDLREALRVLGRCVLLSGN